MGQKVHPYGFRLGYTKPWRSRWFAKHGYATLLHEDLKLKKHLRERLRAAGISSIEIDRPGNKLRITIRTARPGIVIGRRGSEIEKLKQDLQEKTQREVYIDIQEVHRPELDAQLVSESVALQIEKRVAFRRAMRKAVDSALRFGCKGIKIWVAGRLNGREIARSEWNLQGRLPLQTLRADIDYGFSEAFTTYGVIGVKCWIYKGDILDPRGPARSAGEIETLEPARRREARTAGEKERERIRASRAVDRGARPGAAPVAAAPKPAPVKAPPEPPAADGPAPVRPPLGGAESKPAAEAADAAAPTEETAELPALGAETPAEGAEAPSAKGAEAPAETPVKDAPAAETPKEPAAETPKEPAAETPKENTPPEESGS